MSSLLEARERRRAEADSLGRRLTKADRESALEQLHHEPEDDVPFRSDG
jgi:hypothetical protein